MWEVCFTTFGNRANFRSRLFRSPFITSFSWKSLKESLNFVPCAIWLIADAESLAFWCLPRANGELAKFIQRVTMTHTQRYSRERSDGRTGNLSGSLQVTARGNGGHFHDVGCYVERNAQRARFGAKGGRVAVVERARPPFSARPRKADTGRAGTGTAGLI